jgi:flagellar biosynthetic protein FliR
MIENFYHFSENELIAYFLVLLRVSSFVVAWPVFGVTNVPGQVKGLLAVCLAFLIFPALRGQVAGDLLLKDQIILLSFREVMLGLSMGWLARFFFYCIAICSNLISISMGISAGQLFNPELGTQTSSIEEFQYAVGTLIFLAINGHYFLIKSLYQSFQIVPLNASGLNAISAVVIAEFIKHMCLIGIQLSAPILISILFMNIAMAVVGRAVPQINVLVTSLPVNIMLGFLVLIISMPLFLGQMNGLLNDTAEHFFQFLKAY